MAQVDRILTTHVGSLVRPDDFTAVLRKKVAGDLPDGAFEAPLREAVA
jgi:methionine synthase II (cobalamin-independent)